MVRPFYKHCFPFHPYRVLCCVLAMRWSVHWERGGANQHLWQAAAAAAQQTKRTAAPVAVTPSPKYQRLRVNKNANAVSEPQLATPPAPNNPTAQANPVNLLAGLIKGGLSQAMAAPPPPPEPKERFRSYGEEYPLPSPFPSQLQHRACRNQRI